jgi:hypothetical protein
MARDGLDGLGKMRKGEKPEYKPKPMDGGKKEDSMEGGDAGGSKTVIEHHPDGSHSVDGEHMPDHLHMMAHIGHKVTGDRHHVVHHDGMVAHSHSINEDGQHEDHGEHNSADEARMALDKFMGEEAQEPQHQQDGEDSEPEYGGM